ncbi:NAD(P)H-hydrate dehydratase [Laspinema sp. D1]|uniref:NAD(P)H-hydrate dehydratase n=1 Tax=Laspinema palackyanum TaxID=3231601 RepID=UPI003469DBCE|nr:NAD(P)H-hydrate dehydratase [Laspinema sp. D2b]
MTPQQNRQNQIHQFIVTSSQMSAIEERIFAAGMPVAALMEKVAQAIFKRLFALYPRPGVQRVGVLVGPGHNGGDALVVARELHFAGYEVLIYRPLSKSKELTQQHGEYVASLGVKFFDQIEPLLDCDLIVDGLFGFGLERSISGEIAQGIDRLNEQSQSVISIDLPSGLHTDTGEVLGTAIQATHTFCLGLWKLGLFHDQALAYVGKAELIDFDIPLADIQAVLGDRNPIQRITSTVALAHLPLPRPQLTHKYKEGHLLAICGSQRYMGAALLCGLGAKASGVGMLTIAVPKSLKPYMSQQLADALVVGCPETASGAIAQLPDSIDLSSFGAIACGCGLTLDAMAVVQAVLESDRPLILDADGLNALAQLGTIPTLCQRQAFTLLTPHPGEFKRLFPEVEGEAEDGVRAVRRASEQSGAVVMLKQARTAIGYPDGSVWINPESTPALARGGSGDVLTGLSSGLIAQAIARKIPLEPLVQTAVWWHAQSAISAASVRTELGVDAVTLSDYLLRVLPQLARSGNDIDSRSQ